MSKQGQDESLSAPTETESRIKKVRVGHFMRDGTFRRFVHCEDVMVDYNKSWLRYSDRWNLELHLDDEAAVCLDTHLDTGVRTTRVQVNVTFKDSNGDYWSATRIIPMRLRRDEPKEIAS